MTVVVILGVLSAIALPVLASQKSKAHQATAESDLRVLRQAQLAWLADDQRGGPTADVADLESAGYNPSAGITASARASGQRFWLCVKHRSLDDWLVYDSETGETTGSATDACA